MNSATHWKRCRRAGILLAGTALLASVPAVAQGSQRQIVVVGRADANRPDARQAALEDAIRSAVGQVGGSEHLGASAIDLLIEKRGVRLTGCEGSISSWQIRGTERSGDVLEMTVEFRLQPGTLREELMETSFAEIDPTTLYDWVGRPRVVVALDETMDGEIDERRLGMATLEDELINRSVDVFSREQVDALIQRDKRLAFDRPDEAARLGEQLGADLVLTGSFTTNFSRETPPIKIGSNEVKMVFYTSYIQLRLVETSTGRILLSKNWDNSDPGEADLGRMGKHDAAIVSKKHLATQRTPDLIAAIAEAWRKSLQNGQQISVQFQGAAADDLVELDRAMSDLPRMADSRRRAFIAGAAVSYDVRYRGQQTALEEALTELRRPQVELARSERGSIAVRVKKAAAKPVPQGAVKVVSVDQDPGSMKKLEAWIKAQAEVTRVEPDPVDKGSLRAFTSGTLTSGELFRRLTASASDFDAVGLDRNSLQVRTGASGASGG